MFLKFSPLVSSNLITECGVIDSIRHPWVVHASRLAREKKYRTEKGRILIGGHHIFKELLLDSIPIAAMASTKQYRDKHKDLCLNSALLSETVCKYITREAMPEGILAEIPFPLLNKFDFTSKLFLVLFNTSLPSNLGSLARSAVGFGFHNVILVGSVVDPFHYESIRTSKGATLRAQYLKLKDMKELELFFVNHNVCPILTLANKEHLKYFENGISYSSNPKNYYCRSIALIMGNESKGLNEVTQSLDEMSIKANISNDSNIESLNVAVAGGILMNSIRNWK